MTKQEVRDFLAQFDQAREDFKTWPQWMQDAAVERAATFPKPPKAGVATPPAVPELDATFRESIKARDAIEEKAREIYDGWKDQPGWVPWVEGGNSHRQDDARRIATSGVAPSQEPSTNCPACKGYGRVDDGSGARSPYGPKCPTCGGSGRVAAGVREAVIVQCPGCGEGVAEGMACRRKRGATRPPDCKASPPRDGDPDTYGVTVDRHQTFSQDTPPPPGESS